MIRLLRRLLARFRPIPPDASVDARALRLLECPAGAEDAMRRTMAYAMACLNLTIADGRDEIIRGLRRQRRHPSPDDIQPPDPYPASLLRRKP